MVLMPILDLLFNHCFSFNMNLFDFAAVCVCIYCSGMVLGRSGGRKMGAYVTLLHLLFYWNSDSNFVGVRGFFFLFCWGFVLEIGLVVRRLYVITKFDTWIFFLVSIFE